MSIPGNIYTADIVYISKSSGNAWGTLNVTMAFQNDIAAETENQLVVDFFIQMQFDGIYGVNSPDISYNHTGNGLSIHPYYVDGDNTAHYFGDSAFTTQIFASGGLYNFWGDGAGNFGTSKFVIPKTSSDQNIRLGADLQGYFIVNDENGGARFDPNTNGYFPGGWYPFFAISGSKQSDCEPPISPPYCEYRRLWSDEHRNDFAGYEDDHGRVVANTKGAFCTSQFVLPGSGGKIWYYDQTGIPHKGQAYYYDESGMPHKAKAVYHYDENGVPHKAK